MNHLYCGDNLQILRERLHRDSVDLVYLDPPFKSDQDYNFLFREKDGTRSASQILAFEDTWEWNQEALSALEETIERGGKLATALTAIRAFVGDTDMLAYIAMMAPRLVEMHRVLKPTGSIYLHCDSTAGHYLKLLMDAIFGPDKFRNEIIWRRTNTHSDAKRWSPVSDTILYYSKGDNPTWNPLYVRHSDKHIASKYRAEDERGRYTLSDMTSPKPRPNMMYEWKGFPSPRFGWRYSRETMAKLDAEGRIWYPESRSKRPRLKRYLDKMAGVLMGNVWSDINPINSQAEERIGYPTQKPQALLERIIAAGTREGDIVLDPFCGCGTAIEAAQKLGRQWIGIDVTPLAISVVKGRLEKAYGPEIRKEYKTDYEPRTMEAARALADEDPFEFQCWVVEKLGGSALDQRKGSDRGIDGRLYFRDDLGGSPKHIVVSVKSGKTLVPSFVRDLRGTMERDHAAIGVLVSLEKPTKAMVREALASGQYKSLVGNFPKIQVLTVDDILNGKGLACPPIEKAGAKKRARAEIARTETQMKLPGLR